MLLSATCAWHMALEESQAEDIEKFVKTTNIICYGVVMVLGKPTALYESTMDNKLHFTQLSFHPWSSLSE